MTTTLTFACQPDYIALARGQREAPNDVARLAVLVDWLDEWCQTNPADDGAAKQLDIERRELTRHRAAVELHKQLAAVDLATIPVMTDDRHCGRKVQAKLTRTLFSRLKLKGISVTAPDYSMARTVDVRLPKRIDFANLEHIHDHVEYTRAYRECPVHAANREAKQKVEAILAIAFPNHDDRSDTQTDYFDDCWSVS